MLTDPSQNQEFRNFIAIQNIIKTDHVCPRRACVGRGSVKKSIKNLSRGSKAEIRNFKMLNGKWTDRLID